jgi:hypothetical protein
MCLAFPLIHATCFCICFICYSSPPGQAALASPSGSISSSAGLVFVALQVPVPLEPSVHAIVPLMVLPVTLPLYLGKQPELILKLTLEPKVNPRKV